MTSFWGQDKWVKMGQASKTGMTPNHKVNQANQYQQSTCVLYLCELLTVSVLVLENLDYREGPEKP